MLTGTIGFLRTMLDTSREMVRASVCLRGLEVKILRSCLRIERKVRVHICHLASIRRHSSSGFSGLDVSPDHRCHVALVVHEACVKVWILIGVGRLYVSKTTREWIFLRLVSAPWGLEGPWDT